MAKAQDAGLVRILCVAREGANETLHEPPTADSHGGWCGGWELETPGYPIRRHFNVPQHFLYLIPLLQLQGSFLPCFGGVVLCALCLASPFPSMITVSMT